MTPEETAAYFDDPAHAQEMCDTLTRTHSGWTVWRGDDRLWRGRHQSWPDSAHLASTVAGTLNELMYQWDADDPTAERGDPRPHTSADAPPLWTGEPT